MAGGRIVNVASIIGFTGYSGLSVYAATKASMLGFTRSLAREVGRMGVNVNAVAPGFMDTDMTQAMTERTTSPGHTTQCFAPDGGCRRCGKCREYLLGEGGRNISGTVLTVDAGTTA